MVNENRSLDVPLVAPHWLEFGSAPHREKRPSTILGANPRLEGIGDPRQPLCYAGNVPSEISTACRGGYYQRHHDDHVHGGPTASSSSVSRFADRSSHEGRNDRRAG